MNQCCVENHNSVFFPNRNLNFLLNYFVVLKKGCHVKIYHIFLVIEIWIFPLNYLLFKNKEDCLLETQCNVEWKISLNDFFS